MLPYIAKVSEQIHVNKMIMSELFKTGTRFCKLLLFFIEHPFLYPTMSHLMKISDIVSKRFSGARSTTYAILVHFYVILRMKIDLNASFRILICSEYQRTFFSLQLIEEMLHAPYVDVKGQ